MQADRARVEADEAATTAHRQDALCRALADRGVALSTYRLTELPGSPQVGHTAHLRSCELSFRLEELGVLLLVHYRRLERSRSLRNPFADLIAFLQVATRPEFGVRRVMGQIRTEPHPDGDGLADDRLSRFYERFFHTGTTRYDHGDWLYSDIEPLLRRLVEVGHQAAPLAASGEAEEPSQRHHSNRVAPAADSFQGRRS